MPSKEALTWLGTALGVAATPPSTSANRAAGGGGVRPSEMIAGASGVRSSCGDNTNETAATGSDFAEGSRVSAQNNVHPADACYADGSNQMQSPNLGRSADFALRYGIGFLCSQYPAGWNNLQDVADYNKPNSTYLRAFSGLAKTKQYLNPKRSEVLASLATWVGTLAKDLPRGKQGELVASFQGHGAHGSFFASDGGEVTSSQMMAIAKAAEKKNVSITFVLDACFAGGAVPEFQDHAADAVDRQIEDNVEGANQVCSQENHQNAEALRDQMAHARELILFSKSIGQHGDTLDGIVQTIEAQNRTQDWDAAMAENRTIIQLIRQMQGQFQTNMNFGSDPRMNLGQITAAFETILSYLATIQPYTSFDYSKWTGAIGKFEDQISDGANRIINLLAQQSKAS